MPHAGVFVLASLISGVSTALILASGPSYTEPHSPQGTVYDVKRGQSTYDGCRAGPCQIAYLNSVEDFCLWAPSQPALPVTRNTEHTLVAWCMNSAYATRLIPEGTITGAHLVITPEYVQITGAGKLTNINIPIDGVASASGQGHPVHGVVFTSAYGQLEQIYDWTSFVSQERFCFRACKPSAVASGACAQIRNTFGCSEIVLGDYDIGAFEDCIRDPTEVPPTSYQEVLAVPSHYTAHPFSSCRTRNTVHCPQVTHARRAIVPLLVTSLSRPSFPSHMPITSPVTTATDTATTITFPSFPTSTSTASTSANSSMPVSSDVPTSTPYSYNNTHTHSHWHSHSHKLSHHHSSTFSASASSSHHSSSYSPSPSSTASSLNDTSSTSSASSSPVSSTPSFAFTSLTYSPDSSSETSISSVTSTSTLTSTPAPTSSFPSSHGTSSSFLPGRSSSPWSPYDSSTPSSVATPTSSSTSPSSIPSQSPYGQSFTLITPSSSAPTTSPTSSSSPVSPLTSSSTSSSASSQSSYGLTFTTPSAPVPTTSPASSSSTVPNSQTQIGSQCPPPLRVAVNAGPVVSLTSLLPLTLAVLMLVLSSSVGILVL